MKMPMPEELKQLRSLFGSRSYYRRFLRDMPITAFLKQGV